MDQLTIIVVGIIGFLVFLGIVGHTQTAYYFRKWSKELQQLEVNKEQQPYSQWIQRVISEYKQFHLAGVPQLNTQGLIEKHLYNERIPLLGVFRVPVGNIQRLLSQLPSFTIILGVLGTFIGLTLSLLSMQDTLMTLGSQPADSNLTLNAIISSLTAPFEGMSVAFLTSIAGIGAALLLNLIQSGFFSQGTSLSYMQNKLLADCEIYLDHHFNSILINEKPQDSVERILDRLAARVESSFDKTLGDFASQMVNFTAGLQKAMEDVNGIFEAQRHHSERFAASATQLDHFGERFNDTTEKMGSIQKTVDTSISALAQNISSFEQQLKTANDRHAIGQQKFEQLIQRSDKILQEAQRRSEDHAQTLLRGMQEQLQHYQAQHDALENRMAQKQDEWHYRYAEKQGEYGRAAADFASSVQQLEKGFYSAVEHIKRDFTDQVRNIMENQSRQLSTVLNQQQNQYGMDDGIRELSRTLENLYQGLSRSINDNNRTLSEMYHLLQRIYQSAMNQTSVVYEQRSPRESQYVEGDRTPQISSPDFRRR
jgi:methyl-accepting chemotaxis protein